jgi:putative membrane protein
MNAKEDSNNFFVGILLGAVTWLPGISAGIVAVLFGIYERLIDDVSHIRTKLRQDMRFLVALGSGVVIGIAVMVFVVDYLMGAYFVATMFLFVGLIIGQLPDLVKITKRGEPTKAPHIVWLALGFAAMMVLLFAELYFGGATGEDAIENSGLMVGLILSMVAGIVFAISKIIPGISGSTVLLALGLYGWLVAVMTGFQLIYLLPFGIGFVVGILVFAKVMWHILKMYHHQVYYFILGLTIGSIVLILAITDISGWTDVLVGIGAAVIGVIISLAFSLVKTPSKSIG